MVDITKCTNEECELKNKCRRYTATDNEFRQSYAYFDCSEDNQYENILEIRKVR